MKRFVAGTDRKQAALFPECLEDWINEDSPVRVIDAFVDRLDLDELGFDGVVPAKTGRPACHPSVLLKLYVYGYLNRVQSSRRLAREVAATSRSCGCWAALSPTTRRLLTSGRTAVTPFARCARASSSFAGR